MIEKASERSEYAFKLVPDQYKTRRCVKQLLKNGHLSLNFFEAILKDSETLQFVPEHYVT